MDSTNFLTYYSKKNKLEKVVQLIEDNGVLTTPVIVDDLIFITNIYYEGKKVTFSSLSEKEFICISSPFFDMGTIQPDDYRLGNMSLSFDMFDMSIMQQPFNIVVPTPLYDVPVFNPQSNFDIGIFWNAETFEPCIKIKDPITGIFNLYNGLPSPFFPIDYNIPLNIFGIYLLFPEKFLNTQIKNYSPFYINSKTNEFYSYFMSIRMEPASLKDMLIFKTGLINGDTMYFSIGTHYDNKIKNFDFDLGLLL